MPCAPNAKAQIAYKHHKKSKPNNGLLLSGEQIFTRILLYDKFKRYGLIALVVYVVVQEVERTLEVATLPSVTLVVQVSLKVIQKLLNRDTAIIRSVVQQKLVVIFLPEAAVCCSEHRV